MSVFAEYAGPRSADKFIKRVNDRGATLLKYPEIGHPEMLLADRQRKYRSISLNTNYSLVYYMTMTTIWIVDIWDRRKDPAKLVSRIR